MFQNDTSEREGSAEGGTWFHRWGDREDAGVCLGSAFFKIIGYRGEKHIAIRHQRIITINEQIPKSAQKLWLIVHVTRTLIRLIFLMSACERLNSAVFQICSFIDHKIKTWECKGAEYCLLFPCRGMTKTWFSAGWNMFPWNYTKKNRGIVAYAKTPARCSKSFALKIG